jgi:hypothetical protein
MLRREKTRPEQAFESPGKAYFPALFFDDAVSGKGVELSA